MTALSLRKKSKLIKVRSHAWAQSVDGPAAWAREHRWLLEAAFAAFNRTGEWPLIEDVQANLAGEPDRAVAAAQLVVEMPPELGARHSQNIQLTVRALVHVPAATDLLNFFVQAMRLAVTLYPGDGAERPTLRGSYLKEQLDLDETSYRRLSKIVCDEGWFFAGGGEADGDWYRYVRAEILRIRDIQDVDGYLDELARHRFGPAEVEVARSPGRFTRLRRQPLRWFGKRDPTVSDLIVVGVITGVVAGVLVVVFTT
jgi:hypothetical protein